MSSTLENKEKRIRDLLARMTALGAMRPGTLSVQYRDPANKKTPFNQLSYTHKGKSRSEYVRSESLSAIRKEIQTHRKFRCLIEQVTDLSLQASQLRHKKKRNRSRGRAGKRRMLTPETHAQRPGA